MSYIFNLPAVVAADVGTDAVVLNLGREPGYLDAPETDEPLRPKKLKEGVDNGSRKGSSFNIYTIIAVGLIFVVLITWFQMLREWMEYLLNMKVKDLDKRALDFTLYTMVVTIIGVLGYLLIRDKI